MKLGSGEKVLKRILTKLNLTTPQNKNKKANNEKPNFQMKSIQTFHPIQSLVEQVCTNLTFLRDMGNNV